MTSHLERTDKMNRYNGKLITINWSVDINCIVKWCNAVTIQSVSLLPGMDHLSRLMHCILYYERHSKWHVVRLVRYRLFTHF